jgi:hypothetical protein
MDSDRRERDIGTVQRIWPADLEHSNYVVDVRWDGADDTYTPASSLERLKLDQIADGGVTLPQYRQFIERQRTLIDRNEHTESIRNLAHYFAFEGEERIMQAIRDIHELEGHIPLEVANYRRQILKRMLSRIERDYGSIVRTQVEEPEGASV